MVPLPLVPSDNRRSMEVGMDAVSKTRVTDVSRELAQERYRVFKEQVRLVVLSAGSAGTTPTAALWGTHWG